MRGSVARGDVSTFCVLFPSRLLSPLPLPTGRHLGARERAVALGHQCLMDREGCTPTRVIDIGTLVSFVEIERETNLHEWTGVGSDLYAQLIEGAI